jgi:small subunit ribosomal protein S1
MSWTRRISHPSDLVQIGDEVDVVVLDINQEKQEISLGMKQTETNPWTEVEDRYPVGTIIEGVTRNLTSYGAFVEIEEGIDGLLHVSDMSWTKKVTHPSEALKKGDLVRAVVLSVDTEKRRVALGMKQLEQDPWQDEIPRRYGPGDIVAGKVTKVTNFGVFVSLEDGLEGLLHISELTDRKVETPEEIVKIGQVVDVRVLKVDTDERKIGLSMIGVPQHTHLTQPAEPEATPQAEPQAAADELDAQTDAALADELPAGASSTDELPHEGALTEADDVRADEPVGEPAPGDGSDGAKGS